MIQTINSSQFHDAFHKRGRGDQFSYDGLNVLFDWIEQHETDTGSDTELDVIGLCCEFSEESPADIARAYSIDLSNNQEAGGLLTDIEEIQARVLDYLYDHGNGVCGVTADGFIVYQQF